MVKTLAGLPSSRVALVRFAQVLTVTTGYFITGWLGLKLPYFGSHITLIWLPTGIAVAALMRWGVGMWPGVALGALLVNLAIGSSFLLAVGTSIPRDVARAQKLYARTCDAGNGADCHALGRILQRETVSPDRKATFEVFSKGCAAGSAPSCYEVAAAWDAARDPKKALPFYDKACAGGQAAACERARKLR